MSYATIPLRLALGIVFILHGAQKLFVNGPAATGEAFESMGLRPGIAWALIVGCIEFVSGLLVLAGLATRWAAAAIAVVMLGAIFQVHLTRGGVELPFVLLSICIALFISGAPRWSLDASLPWTRRLDPLLRPGV